MTVKHPEMVFLEEDGVYEIRFRDQKTGSIFVSTQFEKDTLAPFLTFSKDIDDGAVEGPIEFVKHEPSDQVELLYNGNFGQAPGNTLETPGMYRLRVTDEAGNSRAYQVEIKQKYRIFEAKTVIAVLLFLMGSGLWFVLNSKKYSNL